MLTLVAAAALAVVRPPSAHLALGGARAPLAISSWCWQGHCGAPIAASSRVAIVPRGYTVNCVLTFQPTRVTLTVGGHVVPTIYDGTVVMWRANRAGGITLRVDNRSGWIVYVGRIGLKHA
jgi:hypothetical protein